MLLVLRAVSCKIDVRNIKLLLLQIIQLHIGFVPIACGTNHYCHLIEFDVN